MNHHGTSGSNEACGWGCCLLPCSGDGPHPPPPPPPAVVPVRIPFRPPPRRCKMSRDIHETMLRYHACIKTNRRFSSVCALSDAALAPCAHSSCTRAACPCPRTAPCHCPARHDASVQQRSRNDGPGESAELFSYPATSVKFAWPLAVSAIAMVPVNFSQRFFYSMCADCRQCGLYCRWLSCCARSKVRPRRWLLPGSPVAPALVRTRSPAIAAVSHKPCFSRAIFGGSSQSQPESNAAAPPQQFQQAQEAPCTSQMNAFAKCRPLHSRPRLLRCRQRVRRCMQANNDNFQACSFYFDMMKQCKASAGQN